MNKIIRLFASKIQQSFCGVVLFYLKLEHDAYKIITQILNISISVHHWLPREVEKWKGIGVKDTN